jgi:YHS domain-containing protein
MILSTLVASLVIGQNAPALVCTVNPGHEADTELSLEYAGVKNYFCCEDCVPKFKAEPAKYMKAAAELKAPVGEFLFDPVSGKRIKSDKARGTVDFKGVRYFFASKENLAAFNKDPKKFSTVPAKESLVCPVMKEAVATYSKADSYVDYKDVRYYLCCAGCVKPMQTDPAKYIKNVTPSAPKVR